MTDLFDLPKLTTLSLDSYSFYETNSIILLSTSHISSSPDIPFTNGQFSMSSKKDSRDKRTFYNINNSSIKTDSASSPLKKCILNKCRL